MPMIDRGSDLGDYCETALVGLVPGSLFFLIVYFSSYSKIYKKRLSHNYECYFDSCLLIDHVHLLAHDVLSTERGLSEIFSLLVVSQRVLKLFQIFMLDGYVMKSDYHYCESVIVGIMTCSILRGIDTWFITCSRDQLILNEKERLHGMVKCQFVLAHLG